MTIRLSFSLLTLLKSPNRDHKRDWHRNQKCEYKYKVYYDKKFIQTVGYVRQSESFYSIIKV